ncbi:hypothetical protein H5J25_01215 [Sphingomonas aliaeris]|uniref:Uncharacterized protein n=1 Tax=Sphingomonas aliaeris TaxID=2759526 RepID=A0A974NV73_9SPHN|nr:hypothetical protein [Sphingomonas aliaeris]QQV77475.1 hypothetical protein H5J25_01215 [Sphingomonas aliaeris]
MVADVDDDRIHDPVDAAFMVRRYPPLNDLIGHMGRYHVALEIDHNAVLARNWSYRWP